MRGSFIGRHVVHWFWWGSNLSMLDRCDTPLWPPTTKMKPSMTPTPKLILLSAMGATISQASLLGSYRSTLGTQQNERAPVGAITPFIFEHPDEFCDVLSTSPFTTESKNTEKPIYHKTSTHHSDTVFLLKMHINVFLLKKMCITDHISTSSVMLI